MFRKEKKKKGRKRQRQRQKKSLPFQRRLSYDPIKLVFHWVLLCSRFIQSTMRCRTIVIFAIYTHTHTNEHTKKGTDERNSRSVNILVTNFEKFVFVMPVSPQSSVLRSHSIEWGEIFAFRKVCLLWKVYDIKSCRCFRVSFIFRYRALDALCPSFLRLACSFHD